MLISELGFREEELKKMNEYAVDGAFVGEEVKCRLRKLVLGE